MNERLLRYRSGGPVDLGYGLGTAPPLILQHGDRLDLMIGTDIWTMAGRDDRGLPRYGPPANAAIDENLGWSSVERRGQKRVATLRTADDGTPLELWSFASGELRRYRVSYDTGWTFRPAGSASFPAPDASKGLGTVQLLSEPGSAAAPHLLLGDNDWRQTQPVPPQWNPDLPFPEDLRVRYLGGVWRGRDVTGRVYVARNEGRPDPRYDRLHTVRVGDPASPVLVDGRASPLLVRPFADGETHLLVADFRGGLYDWLLDAAAVAARGPVAALEAGRLAPCGIATQDGQPLGFPGCIASIGAHDLTRNGYPDLLCTMEDGYPLRGRQRRCRVRPAGAAATGTQRHQGRRPGRPHAGALADGPHRPVLRQRERRDPPSPRHRRGGRTGVRGARPHHGRGQAVSSRGRPVRLGAGTGGADLGLRGPGGSRVV